MYNMHKKTQPQPYKIQHLQSPTQSSRTILVDILGITFDKNVHGQWSQPHNILDQRFLKI